MQNRKSYKDTRQKQIEEKMNDLLNNYKENCFTQRLLQVMKKNKIKKIDLARAMNINEQTIRNWFDIKNGYQPQWVNYMFKMFIFLIACDEVFNPIHLFSTKFNYEYEKKKIEAEKIRQQRYKELKELDLLKVYSRLLFNNKVSNIISEYREIRSLPDEERRRDKYLTRVRNLKDDIIVEIARSLGYKDY